MSRALRRLIHLHRVLIPVWVQYLNIHCRSTLMLKALCDMTGVAMPLRIVLMALYEQIRVLIVSCAAAI